MSQMILLALVPTPRIFNLPEFVLMRCENGDLALVLIGVGCNAGVSECANCSAGTFSSGTGRVVPAT